MNDKIFILGAGGMAREVYQIYIDMEKDDKVVGFLVNKKISSIIKAPKPILHEKQLHLSKNHCMLINGIGNPMRKEWIQHLTTLFIFDTAIHPSTILGYNIRFGNDLVINANSILTCDIHIGNHVIINTCVTIAHDCVIGDYVTISPGVHIGGRVEIGFGTFVGIGTSIIQNIKIGNNCIIGAGSVIIDDIPNNSVVYGNPAKVIRKVKKEDWSYLL